MSIPAFSSWTQTQLGLATMEALLDTKKPQEDRPIAQKRIQDAIEILLNFCKAALR